MNFKSFLANPDGCIGLAIESDGIEHFEHVLIHTDDELAVSENSNSTLRD